jgi:hypothetical protein
LDADCETRRRAHRDCRDPEQVYRLITDITRTGEWSPECYRWKWLSGSGAAVPGARFRGYSKLGPFWWHTTAVITAAEEGRAAL